MIKTYNIFIKLNITICVGILIIIVMNSGFLN